MNKHSVETHGVIPEPMPNPYYVLALGIWRDSMHDFKHSSKKFVFKGKHKEAVYEYIKYYAIKFGLCDVHLLGEGYDLDNLEEPDTTDPRVTEVKQNEETEKPTKASGTRKKATRKKSRKKR